VGGGALAGIEPAATDRSASDPIPTKAIVETLIECGAQTAFTLPGLGIT
jgi:hypothetical protein